jgi:hypothetical protein
MDLANESIRARAENVIKTEIENVNHNPSTIAGNGCAACHVLFTVSNKMRVSEQDAADLLSEILLDNGPLNDEFIGLVENVHMRARQMGIPFVIRDRAAKDRYIDSNFRNTLAELQSDNSQYGSNIVLRKMIISQAALSIAQNLGIDYHAATEELYYYMRKNDGTTHSEIMNLASSILKRQR